MRTNQEQIIEILCRFYVGTKGEQIM